MSEKNRIEKVIQYQNMTSGQFAAEIGVQNSTLSHILNNRNNPSLEVLKKILSRFPDISTDWLILGQGSMLRQEKQSQEPTLFDSLDENNSSSGSYSSQSNAKSVSSEPFIQSEMLKSTPVAPSERNQSELREQITPIHHPQEISEVPVAPHARQSPAISSAFEFRDNQGIKSDRKVTKVILYFTDNTFQEFESK